MKKLTASKYLPQIHSTKLGKPLLCLALLLTSTKNMAHNEFVEHLRALLDNKEEEPVSVNIQSLTDLCKHFEPSARSVEVLANVCRESMLYTTTSLEVSEAD
jgi:hypothetical protein